MPNFEIINEQTETMQIRPATYDDIPVIRENAEVVFRATYADIITPDQMDYMIDWMYSEESLRNQIGAPGKAFFIALDDSGFGGYVSVEMQGKMEDGTPLFHLQKIYVMPQLQGTGLGRKLFEHIVSYLRTVGGAPFRIELNVNRNNKAVGFYEKMGMFRDREGDFPIGRGFYMNDYIYALDVR